MTATIASFTLGGSLSDKLAPRPGPAAKRRWQSSVEEINRARKHSDSECMRAGSAWRSDLRLK
jgi:hypothetical protein